MKTFLSLIKIRITVMVMLTTAFGYLFASGSVSFELLIISFGVWLLASGSAVINHIQEWQSDGLMERTMLRPLPSGTITPFAALLLALFLVLIGSAVVYHTSGWIAFGLGLFALIWYNGVYTPLKKVSAFAVIPGSVIGAIPPVIGWIAAEGSLLNPHIAIIAFFFFIWQVPHFWLLFLLHKKDYEHSGMPVITGFFTTDQVRRLSFVWIAATIASVLLFPLFSLITGAIATAALLVVSGWLLKRASKLLKPEYSGNALKAAFTGINIFVLLVITIVSLERLTEII